MIPNEEKLYYFAVKELSALLRRITSKLHGDFYCMNWLHSFAIEKILNHINKYVKINMWNCIIMWKMIFEDTKILEFNQYQKSDKTPFIIYAGFKYIIEKIDRCKCPENLSTGKVSQRIPIDFSISTTSSFRSIENKHDVYRGKGCIKKFYEY